MSKKSITLIYTNDKSSLKSIESVFRIFQPNFGDSYDTLTDSILSEHPTNTASIIHNEILDFLLIHDKKNENRDDLEDRFNDLINETCKETDYCSIIIGASSFDDIYLSANFISQLTDLDISILVAFQFDNLKNNRNILLDLNSFLNLVHKSKTLNTVFIPVNELINMNQETLFECRKVLNKQKDGIDRNSFSFTRNTISVQEFQPLNDLFNRDLNALWLGHKADFSLVQGYLSDYQEDIIELIKEENLELRKVIGKKTRELDRYKFDKSELDEDREGFYRAVSIDLEKRLSHLKEIESQLREEIYRLTSVIYDKSSEISAYSSEAKNFIEQNNDLLKKLGHANNEKIELNKKISEIEIDRENILKRVKAYSDEVITSNEKNTELLLGTEKKHQDIKYLQDKLSNKGQWASRFNKKTLRKLVKRSIHLFRPVYVPIIRYVNKIKNENSIQVISSTQLVSDGETKGLPLIKHERDLPYEPLVSAIVPNFNHAPFLKERIESILNQNYQNLEVILLDDCSTDDSREILEQFEKQYPDRVRTIFNQSNGGNVFSQWQKGVAAAKGELIWICESDDFCELDVVSALAPTFADHSVMMAVGRVQFAQSDGSFMEGLDAYRQRAEPGIWDGLFVRPAKAWFENGLGINNLIPNVGGCVWRKRQLSETVWKEASRYTTLGDWYLYLNILGGGQLAYVPEAVTYFRQHGKNTSVKAFKRKEFYLEHQYLMEAMQKSWPIPAATKERFLDTVRGLYRKHAIDANLDPFDSLVDENTQLPQSKPHVLIGMLSFTVGGGEIYPIHLANELVRLGVNVSMLVLDATKVVPEVKSMLLPDVPVYSPRAIAEVGAQAFIDLAGITHIHSHVASIEGFFFHDLAWQPTIPYIVTLHGSYEAMQIDKAQLEYWAKLVDHFIYTSDKNLNVFDEAYRDEIEVSKMANAMPIDLEKFPKDRKGLGISDDAFVYTLVARGIESKGWRHAIIAFQALQSETPEKDLHLVLCGEGSLVDDLKYEFGENKNIHFIGRQFRIHGLYRMSDAALVPSRFVGESFPLCIIQSLQTNTPIIASDVGDIKRILISDDHKNGGIVFDYNEDSNIFIENLREGMKSILDKTTYDDCSQGAKILSSNFSMEKITNEYIEFYRKSL